MSDLLRRLVSRAMGQAPLVQPIVGTRFGREPELLSEREQGPADESRRALPGPPTEAEEKASPGD